MASTHEYPNDTVFWRTRGIDQIELLMANDDEDNFDTVYAVLDESLIKGIIIESLIVPKKLDIYDADIGSKETTMSNRLDAAFLDYIRSRLAEDGKGFYNNWRYQLAKKDGGKIKAYKPLRVMPDSVMSVR